MDDDSLMNPSGGEEEEMEGSIPAFYGNFVETELSDEIIDG